jgi:hypothetical protein
MCGQYGQTDERIVMPEMFSNEFLAKLEREPKLIQREFLRSLSHEEMLDLALAMAKRLEDVVGQLGVALKDGFERHQLLERQSFSATQALMAKLRAS